VGKEMHRAALRQFAKVHAWGVPVGKEMDRVALRQVAKVHVGRGGAYLWVKRWTGLYCPRPTLTASPT
jgi:hypothetical protein